MVLPTVAEPAISAISQKYPVLPLAIVVLVRPVKLTVLPDVTPVLTVLPICEAPPRELEEL